MTKPPLPDYDAPIPFDEFQRRVGEAFAELDGAEGEEMRAFIAWFMRRYPTPTERVRYAARMSRSARGAQGALLARLRERAR